MTAKQCGRCRETKELDEFHRSARDGHQLWCKECRRQYDAEYWQLNKARRHEQTRRYGAEIRAWALHLKAGLPCVDCGGAFDPAAMQWDHLPGAQKTGNVSDLVRRGFGRDRILEEIAKCELVCANCHAARTVRRRNGA